MDGGQLLLKCGRMMQHFRAATNAVCWLTQTMVSRVVVELYRNAAVLSASSEAGFLGRNQFGVCEAGRVADLIRASNAQGF